MKPLTPRNPIRKTVLRNVSIEWLAFAQNVSLFGFVFSLIGCAVAVMQAAALGNIALAITVAFAALAAAINFSIYQVAKAVRLMAETMKKNGDAR